MIHYVCVEFILMLLLVLYLSTTHITDIMCVLSEKLVNVCNEC